MESKTFMKPGAESDSIEVFYTMDHNVVNK